MKLTALFAAAALALVAILVAICLAGPAKSDEPRAWVAVPAASFANFPGSVVPDQSGHSPVPSATTTTLPKPSAKPIIPSCCLVPPAVSIKGSATWWDSWGHGFYAAAGPKIRAAYPDYLGHWVTACSAGRCVRVKLTTSCACQPDTRLIDLSLDAFSRLAAPSRGIVEVVVSW